MCMLQNDFEIWEYCTEGKVLIRIKAEKRFPKRIIAAEVKYRLHIPQYEKLPGKIQKGEK